MPPPVARYSTANNGLFGNQNVQTWANLSST
jgi:hypothetical protein